MPQARKGKAPEEDPAQPMADELVAQSTARELDAGDYPETNGHAVESVSEFAEKIRAALEPTGLTVTSWGELVELNPDPFPVGSYREAAKHLRRPFAPEAVKAKVQAAFPRGENPTGAVCVFYIDARLVVERLNLVCPHLWSDSYRPGPRETWCDLTVDGITRSDVGEPSDSPQGKAPKAVTSDALKRAGVKFGIGVSLYALPAATLYVKDGHLTVKRGGKVELTDSGRARLRQLYVEWLEGHGRAAFGPELSHGDVDGAAGDHETDRVGPEEEPDTAAPPAPVETPAVPAEEDWTAALIVELGKDDELKALREYAVKGMNQLGATDRQKVRELRAATTRDQLEALGTRVDNAITARDAEETKA